MICHAGTRPARRKHPGRAGRGAIGPGAACQRGRLAVCAAPDCEHVLVDLSRNRSKRYCDSRTCGNRLHVAAYRARQRTG